MMAFWKKSSSEELWACAKSRPVARAELTARKSSRREGGEEEWARLYRFLQVILDILYQKYFVISASIFFSKLNVLISRVN